MNDKEIIHDWNKRLYAELVQPSISKRRKRAKQSYEQARAKQAELASLHQHAMINKPFQPKVIRRKNVSLSGTYARSQSPEKQS